MTLEELEAFGGEHALAFLPGFNGPPTTYGWFVWVVERDHAYLLQEWGTSIWDSDESELLGGIEIYLTDPKFIYSVGSDHEGDSWREFYVRVRSSHYVRGDNYYTEESDHEDALDLVRELVSISRKDGAWIVTLDFEGLKRLASEVGCDLEFDRCYISLDWIFGNLRSEGVFDGRYFRFHTSQRFGGILIFFDAEDPSLREPIDESSVLSMNPSPNTLIERAESLGPLK
jgi:hypothetical protein